jgi:hypothetical protein
MSATRRVAVLACSHGLGHCKRALQVVARLLESARVVEVDVYMEEWQLEFTRTLPGMAGPLVDGRLRLHAVPVGSDLSLRPPGRDSARYFAWVDRLREEEALASADVVVSDNLTRTLAARPDAVLMGSFLWHDVLRARDAITGDVAAFEEELLARTRPPMLCVDEIAMPCVGRCTQAVRLPWFCDGRHDRSARDRPLRQVLLMGGATEAVERALRDLAAVLLEETEFALAVPPRLLDGGSPGGGDRFELFGFSDADYEACDLVVGRPGVGTVTDCVRFALPFLAFGDENDAEMRHNARRVEELGLGRRIRLNDHARTVRLLRDELTREDCARWSANAASRPCGGIEAAARFVEARLGRS